MMMLIMTMMMMMMMPTERQWGGERVRIRWKRHPPTDRTEKNRAEEEADHDT